MTNKLNTLIQVIKSNNFVITKHVDKLNILEFRFHYYVEAGIKNQISLTINKNKMTYDSINDATEHLEFALKWKGTFK